MQVVPWIYCCGDHDSSIQPADLGFLPHRAGTTDEPGGQGPERVPAPHGTGRKEGKALLQELAQGTASRHS